MTEIKGTFVRQKDTKNYHKLVATTGNMFGTIYIEFGSEELPEGEYEVIVRKV